MADYLKIAKVSDVAPGSVKTVTVKGKAIALANVEGEFFAVEDACTHAGCSLGGEGSLEGKIITCGCHGAKFDVVNGEALALPAARPVSSYSVKIEGEDVLISV